MPNAYSELNGGRITRVKSLEIMNFRGFGAGVPPLNTDADIVLLTGPNGYGKTSFIDALYVLLTGSYFSERRPLTFLRESIGLIKADVEMASGPSSDRPQIVSVRIEESEKEPGIESSGIKRPAKIPSPIVGRASFFFQDLFQYLFDEAPVEEVRETLRGFLVPEPSLLKSALSAVKDASTHLKSEESRLLSRSGIPSETEIMDRRRQVAKEFVQAWGELAEAAAKMGLKIPRRSDQWLFLIQSGNLRKGWESELYKLVEEFRQEVGSGYAPPEPDASVSDLLRLMDKLLNQTKELLLRPAVNNTQPLAVHELLRYLPPESTGELTIDPRLLAVMKEKCDEQSTEIISAQNTLKRIDRYLRHFEDPDGPGLLELLRYLRVKGPEWLILPTGGAESSDSVIPPPPDAVLEWLRRTVAMYYMDGKGLDEHLELWYNQLRELRKQKKEEMESLQKSNQELRRTVEASEWFLKLADREPQFKELIEQTRKQGRKHIDQQTVRAAFADDSGTSGELSDAEEIIGKLDKVRSVVQQWREVEDDDAHRLKSLAQVKNIELARESLNGIKSALEKEKTTRSSILSKALNDLPHDVEKRFEKLVNDVLYYFCRVQGMEKMVLKNGEIKTRVEKKSVRLPAWEIAFEDGRVYHSLSTGQKVQLGLSLMFSLNMALDSLLPHSIIALDDATTALDMAQLPRMAVLLRQMAYQPNDEEGVWSPRRQLFIASHHEDLTNRLLDYLIPPENRSLHILNFTDWKPPRGPEIEVLRVEPALAASKKNRRQFGELLQSLTREA